jgi:DNA-binding NarL/FixJ family response regulator
VTASRLIVIGDHRSFADALAFRLAAETDMLVAGTVTSAGAEALATACRPDLAVIDVEPDDRAVALVWSMRQLLPTLVIVVVASADDAYIAARAAWAGAAGFVTKDEPFARMIGVVRGCLKGETWFPPRLLRPLVHELRGVSPSPSDERLAVESLTPREREVLDLLVAGLDRSAIAMRLFVSTNTVRTHMQNVLRKLGVHSSIEAVGIGLRSGLRPRERIGVAGRDADHQEWRPSPQ